MFGQTYLASPKWGIYYIIILVFDKMKQWWFPNLYIFAVLPSSSGMAISGAVVGYVTGIYNNYTLFTLIIVLTKDREYYNVCW